MSIWQKNYAELAAAGRPGFYSAQVREHHWQGVFLFRAIPNSGGGCVECTSENKDALVVLADRWLAGEMPQGFYFSAL